MTPRGTSTRVHDIRDEPHRATGDHHPVRSRRTGIVNAVLDVCLAAAPTVAFLLASGVGAGLRTAIAVAAVTAAAVFAFRVLQRQKLRKAVPGAVIVAVCAVVAAVTGEERGFFLVPTLIPFAVIAVCLATVAIRRPLTGLLLNRVCGGPADWSTRPRIRSVYTATTWVAVAVNAVNGVVQVVFYRADVPVVLGIAHIATGPVFAALVAITVLAARRAIVADRSPLA